MTSTRDTVLPAASQAGPGQAGPGQAGPGQAGPGQAGQDQAGAEAPVVVGTRMDRLMWATVDIVRRHWMFCLLLAGGLVLRAIAQIAYEPALPATEAQLIHRQPMGAVTKINAIYDRPFWRDDGLNGQVVSDTGPLELVYDNSPPSGSPGVLVAFM